MPVYEKERSPVVFDRAGMMERLMDDEALARKLSEAYLKDIPKRFVVLRECLNEGNVKDAERLSHLIKGASASVGGDILTAVAARMERAAKIGNLAVVKEGVAELEHEFERLKDAMEKEL